MNSNFLNRAFLIFATTACVVALSSCETYTTRRVQFKNHPIAMYVVSKVIDEEDLEYSVKFRNVGREIMSFDYTISDEAGVPHVDADGPNSGLVENLYPGAEVEVPNNPQRMAVWATLGTVTYGKKTKEEIAAIYHADTRVGMAPGTIGGPIDAGLLPLPATEPPPLPGS